MGGFKGRVTAVVLAVLAAAVMGTGCGSGDGTAAEGQGQDPAAVKAAQRKALARYKQYLDREAGVLIGWTRKLEDRIARGDQFESTFGYTNSRLHYDHLRPAAQLFPALNARINESGFDRIERGLYGREATTGLEPVASKLVADVRQLRREIEGVKLRPLHISRQNEQLMEEVSGKMMDGEEEPHSELDLLDVSASVEGVEEGFKAMRPLLASKDPRLVRKAEVSFAEAYERLAEHGDPARYTPGIEGGTSFVIYRYLDPLEKAQISMPLDSLTLLSREASEQLQAP